MKLLAKIAARAALACFGILVALVIGEIGLRVSGLAKAAFYTYDRYRGWGLRPGAAGWNTREGDAWVSINREGFRGPETSIAKPPNTIRIAVLGDSFTEAQQVAEDKTFSAVIGRDLAQCPALGSRKVEEHPRVRHIGEVEQLEEAIDGVAISERAEARVLDLELCATQLVGQPSHFRAIGRGFLRYDDVHGGRIPEYAGEAAQHAVGSAEDLRAHP